MRTDVSIVVPLFNRAELVTETIVSVIEQSHQNWELLVVDDRSQDKSFEVALAVSNSDPRIKVWKREGLQRGGAACRNEGLRRCAGDYITFPRFRRPTLERLYRQPIVICTKASRIRLLRISIVPIPETNRRHAQNLVGTWQSAVIRFPRSARVVDLLEFLGKRFHHTTRGISRGIDVMAGLGTARSRPRSWS